MKVYRIAREKYIKDLSGTGAKIYGGRWNPKGYALLYTSENKSLSALEVLVHLNRDTIPEDLKIITISFPEKYVKELSEKKYKKIYEAEDSNRLFKELGKDWIESKESLGLEVPSVLIPGEKNILINPSHKEFKNIKIEKIEDFYFDERLFV